MFGQLLKRLFSRAGDGGSRAPQARPTEPSAVRGSPGSDDRASAHRRTGPTGPRLEAATPLDPESFALRLGDEVRARVERLRAALDHDDRAGDAEDFLASLGGSFEAVVRHPPLAAQRALSVTRDEEAPISRIVALVEQDPGLGQALLRYANSAYYASRGGQVVSLHAAVHRVGTAGVHNVVLRTMVDGMLCRPGNAFQAQVNETWEHMVRTAPIARAIAAPFGVEADEAYALGLLHDVGKLVIFDRLGELRVARRREVKIAPAIVSAILRILHEPLGGVAALQWGLGVLAAEGIATHHRSPAPAAAVPRSELLFVAQRLDESIQQRELVPLEGWWRDGRLEADRGAVEEAVSRLEPEEQGAPTT